MAESKSGVLWFGTFGHSTYDVESSSWTFSRDLKTDKILLPLYDDDQLHARQHPRGDVELQHLSSARQRASQVTALVKAFPEIQPAKPFLSDLLNVSHAVLDRSSRHDPLKGKQLDIGVTIDQSRHRVEIAAWVSGETGSDVTIAKVVNQRQYWDDSPHAWMSAPSIGDGTTIPGPGAPIQQVCLAQSIAGAQLVPLLAVRMLTVSKLFWVRPSGDNFLTKHLLDLPIESTGGDQHVHIAFNPWFARQFAIVDSTGSWRVWEFDRRDYAHCEQVSEPRDCAKSTRSRMFDDGWYRFMWVGGPTTVIVASRTELRVHTIAKPADDDHIIDVCLDSDAGWIAEVATSPDQPDLLFVLSSTNLLVIRISIKGSTIRHTVLWQVRHFANPEDFTLKMDTSPYSDGVLVILRSHSGHFNVFYELHFPEEDRQSVDALGPFEFVRPYNKTMLSSMGLHIASVTFHKSSMYQPSMNLFEAHRGLELPILQFFYMSDDHVLRREHYCLAPNRTATQALAPPDRTAAKVVHKSRSSPPENDLPSDGTLDDSEHEITREDHQRGPPPPQSDFVRERTQQLQNQKPLQSLLDLSEPALQLCRADFGGSVDIVEILHKAQARYNRDDVLSSELPQQILVDGAATATINHLDDASQLLSTLVSASKPDQRGVDYDDRPRNVTMARPLHRLPFTRATSALMHNGDPSLLYDAIVTDWIDALPPDIPGEVRLAKESLARQVAADLALSSHVVRTQQSPDLGEVRSDDEQVQEESQQSFAGPSSRHYDMDEPYSMSGRSRATSQAPESSATPSMVTSHSRLSSIYEVPKFVLPKYVLCTKPLPTSIARPWQRVLRHWDLGADPADYDWRSRSKHVAQQVEDEELNSQLTEKERARLQRATERYMRRQRKEAAASQSQQLASSQALDLMLTTSQALPDRTTVTEPQGRLASSQMGATSRQDSKPVKKKRKQGF